MPSKIDLLIRTLQLATLGLGKVTPDPLFGWLLASPDKRILAEGWLPLKPILFTFSLPDNNISSIPFSEQNTLYVNALPTITSSLIAFFSTFHVSRICVAASTDDSVRALIPKNITLEDSLLLENEAFVNRRFYTYSKVHRPYLILKWAETADGYIARENYDSKWISSPQSRRLVHKWRTEEDAIMVGTNTAHHDNPRLNVRSWSGRDPVRIVIDKQLRLSSQLHLFDGSQPTICYNIHLEQKTANLSLVRIPDQGDHLTFFTLVLQDLWQRNIQSVIIEGGAHLLGFLIKNQLWDEARVFTALHHFGKGISAPALDMPSLIHTSTVDNDSLKIYQNTKS
ncbi:RibD family protein [Catalinimonas niigatensis]|uniref:RibD family protein n=1 Tax=Catalinimonas niigatensis TaxID=1397264 RepID=UPI0026657412|nr:RibD family protein [Catalinimonas niigatensis]WPP48115.1 RibD family protein [Catalinimonas niigatensis]